MNYEWDENKRRSAVGWVSAKLQSSLPRYAAFGSGLSVTLVTIMK
jgi:hypothetical protein